VLLSSRKPIKLLFQGAALITLCIAAFHVLRFIVVAIMWSNILYGRDLMDASAKNSRGDVVTAETDFFGTPEHRAKTVIRVKRAGHWFATTLVESRSWEVLIGLKWRDDDTLEVQLDFGCDPQTSRPVPTVGPIHIAYHYGDPGDVPKVGYETFRRRDLPPQPCP
jgi:hypothetical protein